MVKPGTLKMPLRQPRRDEFSISIKLAGVNGVDRERIGRIVLKQKKSAPWAQHPEKVAYMLVMLLGADVVKYISGKRRIKTAVAKRETLTIKHNKRGYPGKSSHREHQTAR